MAEAIGATVSASPAPFPHAGAIRWQISGRTFELRSPSTAVLEIGRVVLAHDRGVPAAAPPADERVWQVDNHSTDANAWQVRGPSADHAQAFATPADAVRAVELAALQDLLTTDPAAISLHAALLGRGRTGLLIVGPSESGKSTLATALWRHGLAFCGDDVALVAADGAFLSAFPRRVSLRHGSRALLGEALWHRLAATASFMATAEGCLFHPHELPGSSLPVADLAPAGIVFLARRGVSLEAAELRPIPPAQALLALAPYSNVVRNEGMGPALQRLQPLLSHTPALALSRLKALLDAGLSRLTLSFDQHHAEYQGPGPAVNIVRAGGRLGIPVNINVTRLRDEAGLEAIVAPFANLPAARLRFYDVQPVGAAERTVAADAWRGETSGFCSACDAPAVTDDGRLIACNGPAYFTPPGHPLRLGSLREQPLAALLAAHRDDPLLETIRTLGPERLRQELGAIPGFEALASRDRYRGLCDLCLHITSDPAAVSALRERLSNSRHAAERQAMALLIAHQRQAGALNRQIVNAGGAARLFHRLLTLDGPAEEAEYSQLLGRSDLDWMHQADMLLAGGLARPLLAQLDAPAVVRWAPAFFATRVREAALREGLRELVQIDALERIDRALVALGGRGVLLKGAALLARRSSPAILRAAGDIDVLVEEPLAPTLRQQLLAEGFGGDPDAGRSAAHHLAGITWRGVLIEIHTAIMPAFWGLTEHQMLARVQPAPGYAALDTLDPEGMLLHAIAHATTHLFGQGQKSGWDVEHLIAGAGRPLDWPRLTQWVQACRVPRAFWVPCRVLAQQLGLPLAPELLAAAPSDRRQRQLETIARRRLFTAVEGQFAVNPLSRTAVFLLLHDGTRARLAYLRWLSGPEASEARRSAGQRVSAQRFSALPGHLGEALRQLRQLRTACRSETGERNGAVG